MYDLAELMYTPAQLLARRQAAWMVRLWLCVLLAVASLACFVQVLWDPRLAFVAAALAWLSLHAAPKQRYPVAGPGQ